MHHDIIIHALVPFSTWCGVNWRAHGLHQLRKHKNKHDVASLRYTSALSKVDQANIVPIIISRASDVGHGNAPAILSSPL